MSVGGSVYLRAKKKRVQSGPVYQRKAEIRHCDRDRDDDDDCGMMMTKLSTDLEHHYLAPREVKNSAVANLCYQYRF